MADDHCRDCYRYRHTVSVVQFRRQLELLRRWFTPIAIDDLASCLRGNCQLPSSPVLVTFDDGYRNNLLYALPELSRLHVPALVSVTTGYIGTKRLLWTHEVNERVLQSHCSAVPAPDGSMVDLPAAEGRRYAVADYIRNQCKNLNAVAREAYLKQLREASGTEALDLDDELYAFLSWDEVRQLAAFGVTIGSHTIEHSILSRLPPRELALELEGSKEAIEAEVHRPCRYIAYPNGRAEDVSSEVTAATSAAGYEEAFTLMGATNSLSVNPLLIDRINIVGHVPDSVFDVRVSGLHRLLH